MDSFFKPLLEWMTSSFSSMFGLRNEKAKGNFAIYAFEVPVVFCIVASNALPAYSGRLGVIFNLFISLTPICCALDVLPHFSSGFASTCLWHIIEKVALVDLFANFSSNNSLLLKVSCQWSLLEHSYKLQWDQQWFLFTLVAYLSLFIILDFFFLRHCFPFWCVYYWQIVVICNSSWSSATTCRTFLLCKKSISSWNVP